MTKLKYPDLHPALLGHINEFKAWSDGQLAAMEALNKVSVPLYHYTDAAGLEGIVKNQHIWFTHYLHLNDPSELTYGMSIASKVLKEISQRGDVRIEFFCKMLDDLFTHKNMESAFGFYIASFSRAPNDLGQWRAYGADGKGFALGLAPHLFHVVDKTDRKPHENVFFSPVVYGEQAGRARQQAAIEKCTSIVAATADRAADLMRDRTIGLPFLKAMATELMASQMIWNSLTIKHEAYAHEEEVRLVIVGGVEALQPYVSTRARGSEIVPFIKSDMAIQDKDSIVEVVVGPSAPPTAEDGLKALLRPFHGDPDAIINRSDIPYRGR